MMWWAQGWGWGGWLGMSLVMLVFWAGVIWLIVSLTGFWSKPDASSAPQRAEQVIGASALFASNTSTLPITTLAEAFSRPEDFIGLHFFSPVDRMALVEVIKGRKTSDTTLARALDFVAQIRKTPIVVNDSRGFYTSRVFQTFIHEGMELLREGVAPALIENGARLAGMPVGPLTVLPCVRRALPFCCSS